MAEIKISENKIAAQSSKPAVPYSKQTAPSLKPTAPSSKPSAALSRFLPDWLPRNAWLLSLTSFLNDISSEMIFPILPIFLTVVLGAPPAAMGLIEGSAFTVEYSLRGLSGLLADRVPQRKPLVFLGYLFSAITKPLFAIANTWPAALVIRCADRAGKGVRVTPRDALLAVDARGEHLGRIVGFRKAADNFGAVIGPIVCAALLAIFAAWGWGQGASFRLIFIISFIPAFFGLVILFGLREVAGNPKPMPLKPLLLPPPGPWRSFLMLTIFFGLGQVSWAFFVLRAYDVGVALEFIPIVYVLYNLFALFSAVWIGGLTDKIGAKTTLGISFALFGMACLLFGLATSWVLVLAGFFFYGLFMGAYETSARIYVASNYPDDEQGSRLGAYNWAVGLSALPAGLIAGLLYSSSWMGVSASFAWGFAIALISVAGLILHRGPDRTLS